MINTIRKTTEWEYRPITDHIAKIIAPFTFANDGEHISLTVSIKNNTFYLSDFGDTFYKLATLGVPITPKRLRNIQRKIKPVEETGIVFSISDDLEITSSGELSLLKTAIWDFSLFIYHLSIEAQAWIPQVHDDFTATVKDIIIKAVGKDRIKIDYTVTGISGHAIQIPLAVTPSVASNDLIYIQPITTRDNGVLDWAGVYKTIGKFSDIKEADHENKRIIVLDEKTNIDDKGKAATILASVGNIVSSTNLSQELKVA